MQTPQQKIESRLFTVISRLAKVTRGPVGDPKTIFTWKIAGTTIQMLDDFIYDTKYLKSGTKTKIIPQGNTAHNLLNNIFISPDKPTKADIQTVRFLFYAMGPTG